LLPEFEPCLFKLLLEIDKRTNPAFYENQDDRCKDLFLLLSLLGK
jgi:hypothetical protein